MPFTYQWKARLFAALSLCCVLFSLNTSSTLAVELPTPDMVQQEASGTQPIDKTTEEENQSKKDYSKGLTLNETLLVDNQERESLVYLPCHYDSETTKQRPLVIVLHGARLTGKIAKVATGFDKLACEKDFIVAYPTALNKQWNDGRRRGDTPSYGVNDTAFILKLADVLSLKYNTDPQQVYLVGYSSGGMLAQKIAIKSPDKIAGIGIVAATLPVRQYKHHLKLAYPMPVAIILGTKDHAFPIEGGDTKILGVKVGPVISIENLVQYWLSLNGGIQSVQEGVPTKELDEVEGKTYLTKRQVPVSLFLVNNGGHTWPGARIPFTYIPFLGKQIKSLNAAEVIWETLSPYHRTADEPNRFFYQGEMHRGLLRKAQNIK